jgi:hypothetical protein
MKSDLITKKINDFTSQILLGVLFLITTFFVQKNYEWVLPIMLCGTFFLYLFSPSVAFIYSSIFIIDPTEALQLSAMSVIPFILCFIFLILNTEKCLSILSKDKYLLKVMQLCLLFTLYQIVVSLLLLSLLFNQQDFYYFFQNIKYWLGIWLLVPAYVFIILDRKVVFISMIMIAMIIMILYYLSIFGIYNFFEIRVFKRSNLDDGLWRFFSFDLRQITKIFVYISPLFIIFPIKNALLKLTVPLIGIMVFLTILFALLRTEMFYLFMGGFLATVISIRQFKTVGLFKIALFGSICIGMVLYLFPGLLDTIVLTAQMTSNSGDSMNSDESLDHRLYVQLPVLMKILESNPIFGGGLYSVSAEATTHYLLYDIPVLGAFGAYGIIGMLIYYSRFIYIFSRYKAVKMTQKLYEQFPVECLLTNGLLAYFITMITFRGLHINIELAFDFGMAEFGLFIGLYFGLIKILTEKRVEILK